MRDMPSIIGSSKFGQAFTFPRTVMEWSLQTHMPASLKFTCRHLIGPTPSCRFRKSIDCLNKEPLFWESLKSSWSIGKYSEVRVMASDQFFCLFTDLGSTIPFKIKNILKQRGFVFVKFMTFINFVSMKRISEISLVFFYIYLYIFSAPCQKCAMLRFRQRTGSLETCLTTFQQTNDIDRFINKTNQFFKNLSRLRTLNVHIRGS